MSILSFLALALVRGEVEVTSNVNPIQIYGVLSSQTLSGRGGTGLGRRRGQDWLEPWMIDNLSWALVAETAKRWLSLRLSGSTQVLRKTSGGKALLYVSHQDSLQNFPACKESLLGLFSFMCITKHLFQKTQKHFYCRQNFHTYGSSTEAEPGLISWSLAFSRSRAIHQLNDGTLSPKLPSIDLKWRTSQLILDFSDRKQWPCSYNLSFMT